jgi:hypothetical protein
MKNTVIDFLERYPWTHFITLEFPRVEMAPNRERFLLYDYEADRLEAEKWLRKWRTRLDSALLNATQIRKGRSADLFMVYMPEPTPGKRWLHYHILAVVPRKLTDRFEKNAGDKWRKTLAANAFHFRQDNYFLSASRMPTLYDCQRITDGDGAIGYSCKTLPNDIANQFETASFERFDFL